MELLLFYCIPRQDTNPIAHALLDRFGSLSQVLEAPVEELEKLKVQELEIWFCLPCFENDRLDVLRRETEYGYEFGVRRPDGRYAALAQLRVEQ